MSARTGCGLRRAALLCGVLLALAAPAAAHGETYEEAAEGTPGLVHFWPMGEGSGSSFADVVGSANAELSSGGVTLGEAGGLVGDAATSALFDGSSGAAHASVNLSGSHVLTVEFWMKWGSFASDDRLALEFTPNFNEYTGGFLVDPDATPGSDFAVAIGKGGSRNTVFFARPSAGVWHHYAFVIDTEAAAEAEITPYVDGHAVSYTKSESGTGAGNFASSTLFWMSRDASGLFGAGSMQDLALYDSALSAGTIAGHYEIGAGGPKAAFGSWPAVATAGVPVRLDASGSSSPGGSITDYAWDFDGGKGYGTDAGGSASESHTFSSPGAYTVDLRVKDSLGGTGTVSHTITVGAALGSYEQAVEETSGVSHFWPMGESSGTTFADVLGGANAELSGSGVTLGQSGALVGDSSTAATFDGSAGAAHAEVDLSATHKLTVEFWLKWNGFAENDDLAMELTSNFNEHPGGFLVDPNAAGSEKFGVGLGQGGSRNNTFFARPSAEHWHYYALVLDTTASGATQVVPYVDGQAVSYTKTAEGTEAGAFAKTVIYWMSRDASGLFGAGSMQDLALYETPLSAGAIAEHYELGEGGLQAAFASTPVGASVGVPVHLNASGSSSPVGTITDYSWDFDGSKSYGTDEGATSALTHTFYSPGTYTVDLRVKDSLGQTATVSHTITVSTALGQYERAVEETTGVSHFWPMGASSGSTLTDLVGGADAELSGGGVSLGQSGALVEDSSTSTSFDGSAGAAHAPVDLSSTGEVTVEFWMKWKAYAGDDALALEFTPNFNEHPGGFLVDPDSPEAGGKFGVGVANSGARNNVFFTRPSAEAWHYYAFVIDTKASGATVITPYVDGHAVSYTKSAEGTEAGNLANSTLYWFSRDASSLFGTGGMQDLAIYDGTLSSGRILEHYELGKDLRRPVPNSAIRYVYDADGQLKAAVNPASETAFYDWDAAGNLETLKLKSSEKLSIIELAPKRGATGETITIAGTGFSPTKTADVVKFNGSEATVVSATEWELTVKVPVGATSGTVTVQTPSEGPVTSAQTFTVAGSPSPSITSLSTAVATAGTVVTVTGTNFETKTDNDDVRVNQTFAEVTSSTSTSLKFVVPDGTSSGRILITTPYGSAVGPYLYIPPAGYSTSQVGPTANLTLGSFSTLTIATANTIGLATVDATNWEMLSTVFKNISLSGSSAYMYGPRYEELGSIGLGTSGEEKLMQPITLPLKGTYSIVIVPNGEDTGKVEVAPYYANTVTGVLTPTTEGSATAVSLASPGQKAEYTVSGTAGEEVALRVSEFTGFARSVALEWQDSEGHRMTEREFGNNGFMASVELPTTGTYKLIASPGGASTGSLKLTAYNSTAVSGSITPTTGGESKTITTSVPGQGAYMTFSGNSGEAISLVLSESTFKSGSISVLTSEGTEVSGASRSFNEAEAMDGSFEPFVLPKTGTYTIHVTPLGEETAETGKVKLTAYKVVDVSGSLSPSTGGSSETVSLPEPGQKARYTVSGTAGEEVALKVSEFIGFARSVALEWQDPEGHRMAERELSTNGFMGSVELPTTGTYTLSVEPGALNPGSLELTAYSNVTGEITPSSGGESTTVTTNGPGQNAKITFSGESGEEISLLLSESTITWGHASIYDPEGSLVGEEKRFGSSGETTLGPVSLPASGTYTILVAPENEYTGSVELTAYASSAPRAMVLRAPGSSASTVMPRQAGPGGRAHRAGRTWEMGSSLGRIQLLDGAEGSSPAGGTWSVRSSVARKDRIAPSAHRRAAARMPRHVPDFDRLSSPDSHAAMIPWADLAPAAPPAPLARSASLAGQALKLSGLPLAGLHVAVKSTSAAAVTNSKGQFLLTGVTAGHHVVVVQGGRISGKRYGTFAIGVQIKAHGETTLQAPIWMTPLDPAGDHHIASPTRSETRLTTPRIPGLEVRIPAGTVITGPTGHVVHKLNMTAIPVDRPPFPLPNFVDVPVYFTVQPGRAYLSKGAQIVYPNYGHLPAGSRVAFWNYDPTGRGWYVYGHGSVTRNRKQVLPDPGVRVWEFSGAMISSSPNAPSTGTPPGTQTTAGDPVDLANGLFDYTRTDLVLPDTIPIVIERSYRQGDSNSYSFGIGTANRYDIRLWAENTHEVYLVFPNGGRVLYKCTTTCEGFTGSEYKATNTPSAFYASTLKWDGSLPGWDLALADGTTYVFGELAPLQAIRNKQGQQLTITRDEGQKGNITRITSPHGRWVKFTYNGSNDITEITDNSGRKLKYLYKEGLLESATDPAERTTKYEYDPAGDMTSLTDPRGIKYLETEYDAHDRVAKQKLADGGIYEFSYALNGEGKVEATTVTEPRESERKVTFNSEGWPTSEIVGLGSSAEEKTTFERQAGTGFLLSSTDARSRKTSYEYDSYGNVTAVTRLSETASAQTDKYSYEPGTSQLTKETDPLEHSTSYEYDNHGELIAGEDALGHITHYEYDRDGQLSAIKNPEGHKTTIAYEGGEPSSMADSLGHTTKHFNDSLGRAVATTKPGGEQTVNEYNDDDQLTKTTNPIGDVTYYEYDADGDPTVTTDPRENKTTLTYSTMDLPQSEEDPLGKTSSAVYDTQGNLLEFTDRRGTVDKFVYDPLSRLAEAKYGVAGESTESTIKFKYDSGNRLESVVDSASGTYTPEYDELNRLEAIAAPQGTIEYEYDEAGRRKSMVVPGQEALEYGYDEANRLTELKRGSQTVKFTYDDANLPTNTTLPDGVEEQRRYDEANELTAIAYKKSSVALGTLDYSYDPNGRREAVWGSYARSGLPEAISSTSYNADNEQTKRNGKELSYDANGNLTSDDSSEYKWNARDQLSEITGAISASFGYDPFGRRIFKTLGATTTEILFDGPNAVQETKGSSTTNLLVGLNPDSTYARTTGSATESLLTDALGSTIALGNGEGKVETTYTYDAFGGTTLEGTAGENPFQYAGRENDSNGLYFNRARYYDPLGARFIGQDPLGEVDGPNLYRYADDSPLNFSDAYGTSPHDVREKRILRSGEVEANQGPEVEVEPERFPEPNFDNPEEPPGAGWEWKGKGPPGSNEGSWVSPETKEKLYPDLNHGEPIGPHYDYTAPDRSKYRIYPEGRIERKPGGIR